MKTLLLTAAALTLTASLQAGSQFKEFVRVQGDQLVEEGKPFRFISWNIPNLHLVEDNIPFETALVSGWRWPDRFEITDALATVRQMGGTVVRTYVLSVRRTQDSPDEPRHVLGPGQFNEEAFRALDQVLQVANEQGVRLIIPFVCNWHWWGGRAQYAGFRGKTKDDFWTDPQIIADFKQTIRFVLTRTNTLTGVCYTDDKAILCWETGNELECPPGWTREIAAYIKSLDANHPVMEGFHTSELREESLAMPEVDIVTTHHYPGTKKGFAQLIRENAARAKGRKPYVVGEFGFVPMKEMTDAIQATRETQTAGALAWSLRFRSRDGGFYWHSEPAGGNKYKAFHWPGSPIADDYDEIPFMKLMRDQAFAIRGLSVRPSPRPRRPNCCRLRMSAQSPGKARSAQAAMLLRARRAREVPGRSLPTRWTKASLNIVRSSATNPPQEANGITAYVQRIAEACPSRPTSSARSRCRTRPWWTNWPTFRKSNRTPATWKSNHAIAARRWMTRTAPAARRGACSSIASSRQSWGRGCLLSSRRSWPIRSSASLPTARTSVSHQRTAQDFAYGAGDYGYWRRAIYRVTSSDKHDRFVKIEFTGELQISRVEIQHEAATR